MTIDIFPAKEGQGRIHGMREYQQTYEAAQRDPNAFWDRVAQRLTWFHPYHTVREGDFTDGSVNWFSGGRLNVSFNCLDRHLKTRAEKTAIIWEADNPADTQHISYKQLHREVCRMANVLLAHGVRKGDRVCIYLPMVPELAYTMLACCRIGAIHSVVFAGFSADSLRDRILDCGARVIVTANEGLRGGRVLPLKQICDRACEGLAKLDSVLVVRRTEADTPMVEGRDHWLHEAMKAQRAYCPAEWMHAEDPLFILYTSGSTGKPKGVLHTSGGYLTYASYTHETVFGYRENDIYFCAADIGWITGHSYIIYGPLANGATTIMFESTPMFPNPDRYWDIVERHGVNIFYTAPTAIRALAAKGDQWLEGRDLSSLRVLGTVGEPINPEAWQWYYDKVGGGRCSIVDTWWQTETGGMMITPIVGANPVKPGSATLPFFGVEPILVNEHGERLDGNDVTGHLCIAKPWPSMARTIWGDHERYLHTYFSTYPGYYFTGDGCRRDEHGNYWITGRVDDVLNVSGHRLGTAEIEASINSAELVAESAVVGFPHAIKGTGIFAYVVLQADAESSDHDVVSFSVREQVTRDISKIARPDEVLIVSGLPKTRSGKIMRRILRKIAEHEYEKLGNLTTLADPNVVEHIVEAHHENCSPTRVSP
ncbi:acetate--CoA ligase [Sulfidibacter corallicola]|uniref:Acetate--CoA ligase n=1 Tax=Sulfidibacter corallicola TaxID=2818388 RepID=A0A8A4TNU8_SULCO|nr:acetate--CoA ligase [Sulfidibacter corallicola]QTD50628.1 acetate--CoA ligase [Sulfidibacter corallicola]